MKARLLKLWRQFERPNLEQSQAATGGLLLYHTPTRWWPSAPLHIVATHPRCHCCLQWVGDIWCVRSDGRATATANVNHGASGIKLPNIARWIAETVASQE